LGILLNIIQTYTNLYNVGFLDIFMKSRLGLGSLIKKISLVSLVACSLFPAYNSHDSFASPEEKAQSQEKKQSSKAETKTIKSRLENLLQYEIKEFELQYQEHSEVLPEYYCTITPNNPEDAELSPLAITNSSGAYYFMNFIQREIDLMWQIKTDSQLSVSMPKDTHITAEILESLLNKEFEEQKFPEKEDFIKYNLDKSNPNSYLRKVIVHEKSHKRDILAGIDSLGSRKYVISEQRAKLTELLEGSSEYLSLLGVIIGAVEDQGFASLTELNHHASSLAIKEYFDFKMNSMHIEKNHYSELSRQQIKDIAREFMETHYSKAK